MKARFEAALSLGALSLSIVACASSGPAPGTSTPAGSGADTGAATAAPTTPPPNDDNGDHLSGPYVLKLVQSGGIAGFHMETVIDSAAKTITYGGMRNQSPSSRPLSDQEVAAITGLINEAGLSALKGNLKSPPISDAFEFSLTIRTASGSQTLTWSEGADMPKAVSELSATLRRIREEKFPAQPAGGGEIQ
ncbi:MAG: protealysin inhibitor emfourin [Polyangiaceae bacterium]